MNDQKHIHLIGICGTAMASLAGMLQQRGFRVTGSDAAAYPPMSDFLQRSRHSRGATLRRGQSRATTRPGRDRQRHVARQRRTRARPRPAHPVLLAAAIPARRIPARQRSAGRSRNARQDHNHIDAGVDFSLRRIAAVVPDRRHRRKFRIQLSTRGREALHPRRRRVRHGFFRQGPEIPALLSRLRSS